MSSIAPTNRISKMPPKQSNNLNHLLNFTLPPRQQRPMSNVPRRSRKTGTTQGVWNKERFVNAQYRFVMNPAGDYTVHFADPDIFFQWQDILQVIIPRSSALASTAVAGELLAQQEGCTTCPICLSPPTAPRMTKCGHVFCFPCILHYLSTSENKWARCPICFDSVNARQLKAVKWYEGSKSHSQASTSTSLEETSFDTLSTGSTLKLRLVERPQITTLALPRSHTWPSDLLPPHQAPFHFLPDVFEFAKFMLATPSYLISDLTKELDDLDSERRVLSGMKDTLGVMFIDAADSKVREQIAKASALDTPFLKEQIEKAYRTQQEMEQKVAYHTERIQTHQPDVPVEDDIPHEFLASRSANTSAANVDQAPPTNDVRPNPHPRNQPRQRRNVNPPPPTTSTYYYYQASSGLPIFLYPLDIRILLSHYSSYSSFPDEITVKIEAFAEGTVNDDLRKRCKYLSHMPEGADVVFVEANLEGVVGTDALKNFEGPLKMRNSRRKEKSKKDDRAKARAEEREKANWAIPVTVSHSAGNAPYVHYDGPQEDFSALGDAAHNESHAISSEPSSSPPQDVRGAWGARSFASALHAPSSGRPNPSGLRSARSAADVEDEWDLDVAWHELEQRGGGGGGSGNRKKRGTRLVVLGSGGGGARRR